MLSSIRHAICALISQHKAARRLRQQRRNARTNGTVLTDDEIMRRLEEVPESWRDLTDVTTKEHGTTIGAHRTGDMNMLSVECRRYAPRTDGFPATLRDDWCGEHKPKQVPKEGT